MGARADLARRVAGAGVDIARLQADDRRPVEPWQGIGTHASLPVHRRPLDPLPAKTEQAKRLGDRHVRFFADDDGDGRRPEEPIGLDVPPLRRQHRVARRRQGGEVRHRAAGNKAGAALRRQAENVQEPPPRYLLQRGVDGTDRRHPSVLVPGRGQPVGRQRRRQAAADDVAEEPAANSSGGRGRTDFIEQRHHRGGIARTFWDRFVELAEASKRIRGDPDAARVKVRQIADRPRCGVP